MTRDEYQHFVELRQRFALVLAARHAAEQDRTMRALLRMMRELNGGKDIAQEHFDDIRWLIEALERELLKMPAKKYMEMTEQS